MVILFQCLAFNPGRYLVREAESQLFLSYSMYISVLRTTAFSTVGLKRAKKRLVNMF